MVPGPAVPGNADAEGAWAQEPRAQQGPAVGRAALVPIRKARTTALIRLLRGSNESLHRKHLPRSQALNVINNYCY